MTSMPKLYTHYIDIDNVTPMKTFEFKPLIQKHLPFYMWPYFRGAHALDQFIRLDKPNIFPQAYVVNLDRIYRPGSHWVTVFADKRRNWIIFDPAKRLESDATKRLRDNFDDLVDYLEFVNVQIPDAPIQQPANTNLCGQYCAHYIKERLKHGWSHNDYFKYSLGSSPQAVARWADLYRRGY